MLMTLIFGMGGTLADTETAMHLTWRTTIHKKSIHKYLLMKFEFLFIRYDAICFI